MILQAASSSHDNYLDSYLPKEPLNRESYKPFIIQLTETDELSFEQRANLLNRVMVELDASQTELAQKISKMAAKWGISPNITQHEEKILAYIDSCVLNFNSENCLKKLVPFACELIRQGKIKQVLDRVIQAFARCFIELNRDALINILEKEPSRFIVELSTQLCSNERFLNKNTFEAIKYCFPHAGDMIPALVECLSRMKFHTYPYEKTRLLLREVFELQYRKLLYSVAESSSCNALPIRIAYAEAVYRIDPSYLAKEFLHLFSEKEIFFDCHFSTLLTGLLNDLFAQNDNFSEKIADYFRLVHCYLKGWQAIERLRIRGSKLAKIMYESKLKEKPISIDINYPRDNPIWREFGTMTGASGIYRLFKLDWDFDILSKRSPYPRRQLDTILLRGFTPKIVEVFFPALITTKLGRNFTSWWASVLGYGRGEGPSGEYIVLPEPATIMNRWKDVLADPRAVKKRVYQNLSIAVTEGSATVDEFIALFMNHDAICSLTSEFVHDQLYHLLRTIGVMMSCSAEEYTASLEAARKCLLEAQSCIKEALAHSKYSNDPTMLKILELTLGVFADIYTIGVSIERRNQYIKSIFFEKGVLEIWRGGHGELWRNVFNEYHITPDLYPAIRIQEYWDRIVKNKMRFGPEGIPNK